MNWVIIDSGDGLSPVRRQAITWTNVGLLSIRSLGTKVSEMLKAHIFIKTNAIENVVRQIVGQFGYWEIIEQNVAIEPTVIHSDTDFSVIALTEVYRILLAYYYMSLKYIISACAVICGRSNTNMYTT